MIEKLSVENFTVFPRAEFTFGERLNVVIGENGSGKTQILKLLYAALSTFQKLPMEKEIMMRVFDSPATQQFKSVFCLGRVSDLINLEYAQKQTEAIRIKKQRGDKLESQDIVFAGVRVWLRKPELTNDYSFMLSEDSVIVGYAPLIPEDPQTLTVPKGVFLPAKELLTMYPNYQSLAKEYQLPYDSTHLDTIAKLGLPYMREDTVEYASVIAMLEKAIHGRIFLREEKFYFHPAEAPEGTDFDVNLAAEGWRKLAMLLQLLKNGGLRKGMCLFWDEPDANLNPTLVKVAAAAIVALGDAGVQVFLATHSLFLVNEIEILTAGRPADGGIRYFNLRRGAEAEQGNAFSELRYALILDAALAQSDRYLEEV